MSKTQQSSSRVTWEYESLFSTVVRTRMAALRTDLQRNSAIVPVAGNINIKSSEAVLLVFSMEGIYALSSPVGTSKD